MRFTALHRTTGSAPSELTDQLLQQAVEAGVLETTDLDWKRDLPAAANLAKSDFSKDIAAMANAGGGMIVYGVSEQDRAATGRVDVGALTESYERTMKQVAVGAITPPIMNLRIDALRSAEGPWAVAVEVPVSVDGPHLIYRGEYFGAPIRNGSDTLWMRERDIEAAYRTRLSARRIAAEELTALYGDLVAACGVNETARLIGVARPLLPTAQPRADRAQAAAIFNRASTLATSLTPGMVASLSDSALDLNNPRVGLRRWVVHPAVGGAGTEGQAVAAIHHDGSVTYSARAGADRLSISERAPGHWVRSGRVEAFAVSLLSLVAAAAQHYGTGLYEVRAGIEWCGAALQFLTIDTNGDPWMPPVPPLTKYSPVGTELRGHLPAAELLDVIRDLATDMVNQGGVTNLHIVPNS